MLNELTPSQQMFMLFFSILYGIMLNSVVGLRAFPLASAFAGKDYVGKNDLNPLGKGENWEEKWKGSWEDGYRSFKRLILSVIFLNILPFTYFAAVFQFIDDFIGTLPSDLFCTIGKVLLIGFLSLGGFGFYRFFIGLALLKHKENYVFYTDSELKEIVKKRKLYPISSCYIFVGFVYTLPGLVIVLISLMRLFCN